MKIDYVIMGSDLNPLYYDFWGLVSQVWVEIFNITPVLGLICDEESDLIKTDYGFIKKFKSVDGVSTALQSQIVRLFLPNFLNGNCLLSDIDMIPLSKKYFINNINSLSDNNFHILSSDHSECLANKEYPICYNLANNKLFVDVLKTNVSWNDFVFRLNDYNYGWSTDQKYLYDMVNKYENQNLFIKHKRGDYII